ncbi:hypothetical protein [Amycolatopsis sp. NPDC059021]|uniref:hypothetical protein n=1 Tax=Amycolatopsis sp. NPDC059021 TaxID=3346704 RepID=UPI00366B0E6B
MPTYKVTHETTAKPDAATLPAGAKVEEISPFPVLVTAHGRTLRVKDVTSSDVFAATVKFVAPSGEHQGIALTESQTREIAQALTKAADAARDARTERAKTARRAEVDRQVREFLRAPLSPFEYRSDPFRF